MPEELHLVRPEEAAGILRVGRDSVYGLYDQLHLVELPYTFRLVPEGYLNGLVHSQEWEDRDSYEEAAGRFARTFKAHAAIMTSEEQLDTRIRETYAAFGRTALLAAEAAQIFEITPQTVRKWQRHGLLPKGGPSREPSIDEASVRSLFRWSYPETYGTPDPKDLPEITAEAEPHALDGYVQFMARQELTRELAVSPALMRYLYPNMHRFIGLSPYPFVDARYIERFKASPYWRDVKGSLTHAIEDFSTSPEAAEAIRETEEKYQEAVDAAFAGRGARGTIPDSKAAELLNVQTALVRRKRFANTSQIPRSQPMTRRFFETLYRWQYPESMAQTSEGHGPNPQPS